MIKITDYLPLPSSCKLARKIYCGDLGCARNDGAGRCLHPLILTSGEQAACSSTRIIKIDK